MKIYQFLLLAGSLAHRVEHKQSILVDLDEGLETDQKIENLMDKYEEKEETEPTISDLVQESDEDEDYQSKLFQKYSEDAASDDGMPTNNKVISKENSRIMAQDVLSKEKKFNNDEVKAYLKLNFNRIWKEQYNTKQ